LLLSPWALKSAVGHADAIITILKAYYSAWQHILGGKLCYDYSCWTFCETVYNGLL